MMLLAIVVALSSAACSGAPTSQGSNTPSSQPSSGGETPSISKPSQATDTAEIPSGQAMTSLIKWMMDGTFSFDYTLTSEGPDGKTEGSGSMAVDGENLAMQQEMMVEGQHIKSRVIKKGDKMYMIDDENKYVMEISAEMNPTEGMMTDYGGITKTGEGTGEIDGRILPFEDYTESDTGAVVRYYLDGGNVYGIESDYEGYKTVMIIKNASNSVPSDTFDVPSDYTQMGEYGGENTGSLEDYLPEGFEMPEIDLPEGVTLPDGIKLP